MGESLLGDRIAQGADDVVLAEDIVKRFGSVFPGEDLVAHEGECRDEGGFVMTEFSRNGKMPDCRDSESLSDED